MPASSTFCALSGNAHDVAGALVPFPVQGELFVWFNR